LNIFSHHIEYFNIIVMTINRPYNIKHEKQKNVKMAVNILLRFDCVHAGQ